MRVTKEFVNLFKKRNVIVRYKSQINVINEIS
jgi:hypothetical protein